MRTLRALQENPLPLLLANIQPEPVVTAAWTMDDLTYNQGIHGAQDQSNAMLRAGLPYSVITDEWRSPEFLASFEAWARAAQTVTKLRRTKIALFGYPMNGMEDVLYDATALLRKIGPMIVNENLGDVYQRMQAVHADAVECGAEAARRMVRDRPEPSAPRATSTRSASRSPCAGSSRREATTGCRCTSSPSGGTAVSSSSRCSPPRTSWRTGTATAPKVTRTRPRSSARATRSIGDAHFSEMYAMDYELDSVLISHMGEGNWRVARHDRPIRLVDRPLGIGGLGNPPTTVFSAQPGIATTATLIALEGEHYRLAVARGEVLDTPELPLVQMPYFHFRPDSGMRAFLTSWLRNGGTHHFCLNLGDHVERWRHLAELLDIDFVEI